MFDALLQSKTQRLGRWSGRHRSIFGLKNSSPKEWRDKQEIEQRTAEDAPYSGLFSHNTLIQHGIVKLIVLHCILLILRAYRAAEIIPQSVSLIVFPFPRRPLHRERIAPRKRLAIDKHPVSCALRRHARRSVRAFNRA
jgi:hypothetical protein